MVSQGTFSVKAYCRCGASMAASGAGSLDTADELAGLFWLVHRGNNHGPTDAKGAAAARRREERRSADA